MAYITYDDYVAIFGSTPLTAEQFGIYAELASTQIDGITQYRIQEEGGLSVLSPFLKDAIQKATAMQVLYLSELGLHSVMTGQSGQSFHVGKVSVDGGSLAQGKTAAQLTISPTAVALLEQTPLLERRVPVCSNQYLRRF